MLSTYVGRSLLTAPLVTRLGCRDTLAACLTTAGLVSGIQLWAAALAPANTTLTLALQVSLTHTEIWLTAEKLISVLGMLLQLF